MRAKAAARAAAAELARAGVPDPAFESEYLVRFAAGLTRARYFLDEELTAAQTAAVRAALDRRLTREPAAYITGEREFHGLAFEMTPDVLVPRPETELLVDLALREARDGEWVADIGTGSACVATAIAHERPALRVAGFEVSRAALDVAARNVRRQDAGVRLVCADLATALRHASVVVANLPYIPSEEVAALEPEVQHWEPAIALDGGADGLVLVRRLIDECATRLRPRLLALEIGFGQATATAAYAESRGATTEIHRDLAGIDRVVCCRWP
ncbi:MAG: peptide chain release factor N(5)-glutamine methyltransferase [Dehalococcoidia bacterium]|nr:peptide chain release factor N(5)-glutamine methyltransferase [Dehalococcoidia bacterium]